MNPWYTKNVSPSLDPSHQWRESSLAPCGRGLGEGDSWRILLKFITTPVHSFARRGLRGGFIKQIPYFIDTTGDSVDALHEE